MAPRDLRVEEMARRVNLWAGQGISSPHEGGAYALFCNGAARFLSDETTPETLRRLLDISDGEPVGKF